MSSCLRNLSAQRKSFDKSSQVSCQNITQIENNAQLIDIHSRKRTISIGQPSQNGTRQKPSSNHLDGAYYYNQSFLPQEINRRDILISKSKEKCKESTVLKRESRINVYSQEVNQQSTDHSRNEDYSSKYQERSRGSKDSSLKSKYQPLPLINDIAPSQTYGKFNMKFKVSSQSPTLLPSSVPFTKNFESIPSTENSQFSLKKQSICTNTNLSFNPYDGHFRNRESESSQLNHTPIQQHQNHHRTIGDDKLSMYAIDYLNIKNENSNSQRSHSRTISNQIEKSYSLNENTGRNSIRRSKQAIQQPKESKSVQISFINDKKEERQKQLLLLQKEQISNEINQPKMFSDKNYFKRSQQPPKCYGDEETSLNSDAQSKLPFETSEETLNAEKPKGDEVISSLDDETEGQKTECQEVVQSYSPNSKLISSGNSSKPQKKILSKVNMTKLMEYGHELHRLTDLFSEGDKSKNICDLLEDKQLIKSIIQRCSGFREVIESPNDLEQLTEIFKDGKARKIIRHSIIFQNITVMLLVQNMLSKDVFEANFKHLKGTLLYAHQNFLHILSIVRNKVRLPPPTTSTSASNESLRSSDTFLSNDTLCINKLGSLLPSNVYSDIEPKICSLVAPIKQLDGTSKQNQNSNLNYLTPTKTIGKSNNTYEFKQMIGGKKWVVQLINQIRQNNELQVNSFKILSKNDKDFYTFLINFLRQLERQISVAQNIRTIFEYFSLYLIVKQQLIPQSVFQFVNGFSTSPAPFLTSEIEMNSKQYTLVLDLDETLIHCEEAQQSQAITQFIVRPYLQTFLSQLSQLYELVIFTAGMPDYANWVIDTFDIKHYIQHRLYRYYFHSILLCHNIFERQHTVRIGDNFIKDLSKLGRDLSKVIIVDNIPENFSLQQTNGIFIREWTGDPSDAALAELLPLLKEIAISNQSDVREALKSLKQQIQKNIEAGIQFPHLNLKL